MKQILVLLVFLNLFILGENIFYNNVISPDIQKALNNIEEKNIQEIVQNLSSSEFLGREPGTAGGNRASKFLAKQFRKIGLLPGGNTGTYFQPFSIQVDYQFQGTMSLQVGQQEIENFHKKKEFIPIHLSNSKASIDTTLVFVGYGITAPLMHFDEYRGIDVQGKIVLLFSGVPWDIETRSWLYKIQPGNKFDSLQYKVNNAIEHGAKAVVVVNNPVGWRYKIKTQEKLVHTVSELPLKSSIPVFQVISGVMAKMMSLNLEELRDIALEIAEDKRPQSIPFPNRKIIIEARLAKDAWTGRNIIGILPGRDKHMRKEIILLGAHYDHLGHLSNAVFFPGANDNASGIAALLEVAKSFRSLPYAPARTIVFIAFDGEEMGRIGSAAYVGNPIVPNSQIQVMINFDMVGRNEKNQIYAVATKSSPQVHAVHQQANQFVNLELIHPESYRLGRSDHTAFYYAKVPVMYLFGGLHDGYHDVTDTADLVIPEKIKKIAQLAFLTALSASEIKEKFTFGSKK